MPSEGPHSRVSNSVDRVEFLSPLGEVNAENGNVDVLAHFHDGRIYLFLVATPNNIFWCMDNEGTDFFFGMPPLMVRRLDPDTVLRAVRALAADGKWLDIYGTLQESSVP